MGDILEARLGAIYRDCGSLALAVALFEPARAWIDTYALNPTSRNAKPHPKSALIEQLAKAGCHAWAVEKVDPGLVEEAEGESGGQGSGSGLEGTAASAKDAYGARVTVHGAVLAGAVGRTPHIAQRAACERGLARLHTWDFAGCTCRPRVDASRLHHSPAKRGRDAGPDPAPAPGVEPSKKRRKSSPQAT